MDLNLGGSTALITGASKGIGLAAARAFAAEGVHLHLAARNGDALASARREIEAAYSVRVVTHTLDLGPTEAMQALADAVGEIDILINNAGDIPAGSLDSLNIDAVRKGFELKVLGYMALTKQVYARMQAGRGGVIINDIGNSGENWDADYIAGSTGNAALMAFTRALGGVSLDDGIRVVGVNPGPVATDRMVKLMKRRALDTLGDEGRWEELFALYPGGRAATPEEVADLMLFLASPRAAYITGTIVTIDGGIAAHGSIIKPRRRAPKRD
jgi:NAD(P)-dependent dehydrogenase (short-subunit alcohol dehydrogenase family)